MVHVFSITIKLLATNHNDFIIIIIIANMYVFAIDRYGTKFWPEKIKWRLETFDDELDCSYIQTAAGEAKSLKGNCRYLCYQNLQWASSIAICKV